MLPFRYLLVILYSTFLTTTTSAEVFTRTFVVSLKEMSRVIQDQKQVIEDQKKMIESFNTFQGKWLFSNIMGETQWGTSAIFFLKHTFYNNGM